MTFLAKNVVFLKIQASPIQQLPTWSDKNVVEEKGDPRQDFVLLLNPLGTMHLNSNSNMTQREVSPEMNSGRSDKQGRTTGGGEETS